MMRWVFGWGAAQRQELQKIQQPALENPAVKLDQMRKVVVQQALHIAELQRELGARRKCQEKASASPVVEGLKKENRELRDTLQTREGENVKLAARVQQLEEQLEQARRAQPAGPAGAQASPRLGLAEAQPAAAARPIVRGRVHRAGGAGCGGGRVAAMARQLEGGVPSPVGDGMDSPARAGGAEDDQGAGCVVPALVRVFQG
eukprot:RCo027031